MELQNKIP
jgi:hypothetical protein